MIRIKIKADGAKLSVLQPTVTSGSGGSVFVDFEFDSEWVELNKTAVFSGGGKTYFVAFEKESCEFPANLLSLAGNVKIGVFGTDGTRTLTSVFCNVKISHGVSKEGEEADNYVPGIYEQLYSKIASFENLTVSVTQGAKPDAKFLNINGELVLQLTLAKGEKGDKGDKGDTGEQGIPGADGINGTDGKDGYTPVKGVDYFTDEDISDFQMGIAYTSDGTAYIGGIVSFDTEEEFQTWQDSGGTENIPSITNYIVFINNVPKYFFNAVYATLLSFASPMLESEKDELKAYIDETILGGAW